GRRRRHHAGAVGYRQRDRRCAVDLRHPTHHDARNALHGLVRHPSRQGQQPEEEFAVNDRTRAGSAIKDHKGYADLQEHVAALEQAGLVYRITEPVNKDTEMHALVRWQYRGGVPEHDRKAFLFTNVTDSKGRTYDMPVIVGALAGSREIYRIGLNVPKDDIGAIWQKALEHPIPPVIVSKAPCQEVVIEGDDLVGMGKGLDALPVPISTPGFDSAPYITAGNFVTKDPENGIQNLGTYRAGLKASNRLVVRMATRNGGAGGYPHWEKYRALGQK